MLRPSNLAAFSIDAVSLSSSAKRVNTAMPSSGCESSRPRNMIVTVTFTCYLQPRTACVFILRKVMVFNMDVIDFFQSYDFCFSSLLSRVFVVHNDIYRSSIMSYWWFSVRRNFHKIKMLFSANANASRPDIIPICSFSGPTTRSSRARISSLMRGILANSVHLQENKNGRQTPSE